jgi:UDP-N-acetyl-alpha-D-muramoyl-L-alanyl-L-glutamate epimerase
MNDLNRFDPGAFRTFRVMGRSFDQGSRTASLGYALDDGPSFVETVTFETPPEATQPAVTAGFERALLHLHIAAGTSYYKTAAPPAVTVESGELTAAEVGFHRHLYDDGLREFAVENCLPVPRPVTLSSPSAAQPPLPVTSPRSGGVVVPIGGGKDSMVLIEALRPLGPRLLAVNPHPLVIELARRAGLQLLVVRRTLSPELTVLNRTGALNGHVPITAIVSLIAAVGSFVYGYDTIAMAIERSASEETVLVDGVPVNHQYSKSLEFERLMGDLLATSIDPGLTYGSALRPYSELAIARAFATLTEYHSTFCSCNTAFRQSARAQDRWCGECAKCRFVGLVLAPFMGREALQAVIGRDMFADPGQIAGFAALMSADEKPFECVGERRESAAALSMLSDLPEWEGSPVVTALAPVARTLVSEAAIESLLTPATDLDFPDPEVAAAVRRFFAERP